MLLNRQRLPRASALLGAAAGLILAGLTMSTAGCGHAGGEGPKVLPKKFPGGGMKAPVTGKAQALPNAPAPHS